MERVAQMNENMEGHHHVVDVGRLVSKAAEWTVTCGECR